MRASICLEKHYFILMAYKVLSRTPCKNSSGIRISAIAAFPLVLNAEKTCLLKTHRVQRSEYICQHTLCYKRSLSTMIFMSFSPSSIEAVAAWRGIGKRKTIFPLDEIVKLSPLFLDRLPLAISRTSHSLPFPRAQVREGGGAADRNDSLIPNREEKKMRNAHMRRNLQQMYRDRIILSSLKSCKANISFLVFKSLHP
jgi:hypothetical protein